MYKLECVSQHFFEWNYDFSFTSNLYNTFSVIQHVLSLEFICLKYVSLCRGNVIPVNIIVSENIGTIACGRKKKYRLLYFVVTIYKYKFICLSATCLHITLNAIGTC